MPAPYFLVVEGKRGPKVPASDLEAALKQARLLHERNDGAKRVFVLETVQTVEPLDKPECFSAS